MIKNYIITSLRNLRRNWNFTVINIVGLTLGLACCVLIFFTVRFELSYDQHHKHADRVFRILNHSIADGDKGFNTGMPMPAIGALGNDFPELKNQITCTYALRSALITIGMGAEKKKFSDPGNTVAFIGPEYFNLLDYKWLKGSPKTSLQNPGSVVLADSEAKKFFGNADPMGKTILVENHRSFTVTGIIADPPVATNFPFKTMLSFASLKDYGAFTNWDDWISSYGGGQIYLLLPDHTSKEQFEKQLDAFSKKYRDPEEAKKSKFVLQPLNEIHFATKIGNYSNRTISKGMIWAMSLVGIFILITACVNFVNLATAQALRRSREVGVRKVLGSTRSQLLRQYFSETGLITILSVLLGLLSAQLVLPYISDILDINAEGALFFADPSILLFCLILTILVTLLAGFYPALVVSGYQPILALKGKVSKGGKGQSNLRRGLIVLQFAISQVILIGTLIANSQMNYFRNLDLGFSKDEILTIGIPDVDAGKVTAMRSKLAEMPGVKSYSFSAFTPMSRSNWQTGFTYENDPEPLDFGVVMRPADTAYFNTYNLKMAAGRMYQHSDTIREYVVNEAFAQKLGFKNPQDILGKRLAIGGSEFKLPIVGVVKNFNTFSLHREIIPCVVTAMGGYKTLSVKLDKSAGPQQIDKIKAEWTALYPDYLFSYSFFDETLNSFYDKENKLFQLFRILSGIAIFIGCMGLYGVVAFMAESRTKEMGIRKAVGASALNIFGLFSMDFIKLVLVALVIASPIAWYFMNDWLQDFTYKISISWWIYAIAGLSAVVLALITISFQSVKAALTNPVTALRSE